MSLLRVLFECVLSVIPVGSLLGVSKPIVILVLSVFWVLRGALSDTPKTFLNPLFEL
jgi:hypothetical protein